jgi:hypothetical protein
VRLSAAPAVGGAGRRPASKIKILHVNSRAKRSGPLIHESSWRQLKLNQPLRARWKGPPWGARDICRPTVATTMRQRLLDGRPYDGGSRTEERSECRILQRSAHAHGQRIEISVGPGSRQPEERPSRLRLAASATCSRARQLAATHAQFAFGLGWSQRDCCNASNRASARCGTSARDQPAPFARASARNHLGNSAAYG